MRRQDQAVVVLFEALQRSKAFRYNTNVHGVLNVGAVMTVLKCSRSTASRVIDYVSCHAERDGLNFGSLFWHEYLLNGRKCLRWSTRDLHQWFNHDVSEHAFGRYHAISREHAGKILQFTDLDWREMLGWLSNG